MADATMDLTWSDGRPNMEVKHKPWGKHEGSSVTTYCDNNDKRGTVRDLECTLFH